MSHANTVRLLVLMCVLPIGLAGCGGQEFGPATRVPVEYRYVIAADKADLSPLSLPGERGYNIHIKRSSQDQGASGQARGASDADKSGKAVARAEADNGGSANAEFKLGHRIDNNSAETLTMNIRVFFDVEQALNASPLPAPTTLAKADLVLAVIDSNKRVVSRSIIAQATSDEATGTARLPQDRHLAVRLEPMESYDIILYGTAEASADQDQAAEARIDVAALKMDVTFQSATTRPAATRPGA